MIYSGFLLKDQLGFLFPYKVYAEKSHQQGGYSPDYDDYFSPQYHPEMFSYQRYNTVSDIEY